jgi:hypothetical protein
MPAILAHVQKNFKLTLVNNVPQALVEATGNGHVVQCCPLCGCIHQIADMNQDVPYTPVCQTMPIVYRAQQTTWSKQHPETAKYHTLQLVTKTK